MLIKWLHNSGAPKMFVWLANSLAEQGFDVTVYTYLDYDGQEVTLSNKVHHIHESLNNCGLIGKIKHIRTAIKKSGPDVSISFLLDANVYNMFACYGLKTKSVVCERNDPYKPHYYKLKFWKPWFRLADGAVFQLPKVAEYYDNIKGPTAIIPNPVNEQTIYIDSSFSSRQDLIVTVGRIDLFQKRHDVLIQAFALFLVKHPSYRLVIYGKGESSDEEKLKNLIEEKGLQEKVELAGEVKNPIEHIRDAKFFVLSSDFEGIPNALIEAMSIGLPCISTDCRPGGAAMLIEHGKNGLLVPMGDAEGLCNEMNYMATHPELADSIGEEARKINLRFSDNSIISKWVDYMNHFNGVK